MPARPLRDGDPLNGDALVDAQVLVHHAHQVPFGQQRSRGGDAGHTDVVDGQVVARAGVVVAGEVGAGFGEEPLLGGGHISVGHGDPQQHETVARLQPQGVVRQVQPGILDALEGQCVADFARRAAQRAQAGGDFKLPASQPAVAHGDQGRFAFADALRKVEARVLDDHAALPLLLFGYGGHRDDFVHAPFGGRGEPARAELLARHAFDGRIYLLENLHPLADAVLCDIGALDVVLPVGAVAGEHQARYEAAVVARLPVVVRRQVAVGAVGLEPGHHLRPFVRHAGEVVDASALAVAERMVDLLAQRADGDAPSDDREFEPEHRLGHRESVPAGGVVETQQRRFALLLHVDRPGLRAPVEAVEVGQDAVGQLARRAVGAPYGLPRIDPLRIGFAQDQVVHHAALELVLQRGQAQRVVVGVAVAPCGGRFLDGGQPLQLETLRHPVAHGQQGVVSRPEIDGHRRRHFARQAAFAHEGARVAPPFGPGTEGARLGQNIHC